MRNMILYEHVLTCLYKRCMLMEL